MDTRTEFERKIRRQILKENNIKHLICARCGNYHGSIHLHHIKEIVYGGTNDVENLIPLCSCCHHEWDDWGEVGIPFGTFLLTPKLTAIAKLFAGGIALSQSSLGLARSAALFGSSCSWNEEKDADATSDYHDELARQNKIFNTFPYSDQKKMFDLYGDVKTPVAMEDVLGRAVPDDAAVLRLFENATTFFGANTAVQPHEAVVTE